MNLDSIQLFSMANRQMRWLAARQRVIASNMANINTPRYLSQDIKPLSFKRELDAAGGAMTVTDPRHIDPDRPAMAVTNARHLQAPGADGRTARPDTERRPYESAIDGNGVVLEEQLAKEKDIRTAYDLATAIYGKHVQMFKTAVRSGQ